MSDLFRLIVWVICKERNVNLSGLFAQGEQPGKERWANGEEPRKSGAPDPSCVVLRNPTTAQEGLRPAPSCAT